MSHTWPLLRLWALYHRPSTFFLIQEWTFVVLECGRTEMLSVIFGYKIVFVVFLRYFVGLRGNILRNLNILSGWRYTVQSLFVHLLLCCWILLEFNWVLIKNDTAKFEVQTHLETLFHLWKTCEPYCVNKVTQRVRVTNLGRLSNHIPIYNLFGLFWIKNLALFRSKLGWILAQGFSELNCGDEDLVWILVRGECTNAWNLHSSIPCADFMSQAFTEGAPSFVYTNKCILFTFVVLD